MKKFFAMLTVCLLVLTISFPSYGTQTGTDAEATTEHPETTEYPEDPSKTPDLVSTAAIVMDAKSGQILYEKNAYDKRYPASITKIMTALLTFEHGADFNTPITMSENAIWDVDRGSTLIGLDVGEQVTLGDVIYATMVKSDNSCAYALAEYVAGDVKSFADLMNKKATELGCQNTHFVTPNGLHEDDHYTCAYDMALITKAALQYDQFREVAGTVNYTVPATNLTDETRPFWNGNKMINPAEPYYYEYCEGGKTGYTMTANNTLVTYAKKDGLELICVVLDCDGSKYTYSDTRALYNYCYNNYSYYYPLSDFSFDSVSNEEEDADNSILHNYYTNLDHDMIDLTVDHNFSLLLHRSVDIAAIEQNVVLYDQPKDNILGEITFTYNEEQIGSTSITTSTPSLTSTMHREDEEKPKKSVGQIIKKILFTILVIILSLVVILAIYIVIAYFIRNANRNRNRRRRRRAFRQRQRKNRDDDYYF